jgi:hypothetical protein
MLAPADITMNCVLSLLKFRVSPVNSGYHWINTGMLMDTAPVDGT